MICPTSLVQARDECTSLFNTISVPICCGSVHLADALREIVMLKPQFAEVAVWDADLPRE